MSTHPVTCMYVCLYVCMHVLVLSELTRQVQ